MTHNTAYHMVNRPTSDFHNQSCNKNEVARSPHCSFSMIVEKKNPHARQTCPVFHVIIHVHTPATPIFFPQQTLLFHKRAFPQPPSPPPPYPPRTHPHDSLMGICQESERVVRKLSQPHAFTLTHTHSSWPYFPFLFSTVWQKRRSF